MKIAILIGSIRKGRQSHKVGYYLEELLKQRDAETTVIDLSEYSLPVMGSADGDAAGLNDKLAYISKTLHASDAILLVSPEYHGSFSGAIKNALDYFWSEFSRKPIGVATASSGKMGGINASLQLQQVILSLGAYPLPLKLLVPEVNISFNESLEPLNERTVASAKKFLDEFLWFADAIYQKKQQSALGKVA